MYLHIVKSPTFIQEQVLIVISALAVFFITLRCDTSQGYKHTFLPTAGNVSTKCSMSYSVPSEECLLRGPVWMLIGLKCLFSAVSQRRSWVLSFASALCVAVAAVAFKSDVTLGPGTLRLLAGLPRSHSPPADRFCVSVCHLLAWCETATVWFLKTLE